MNNLVLIDKRVIDYATIVNAVDVSNDAHYIVFDVFELGGGDDGADPFAAIHAKISELNIPAFSSIGLVQHNYNAPFYQMFGPACAQARIMGVETADPTLQTWQSVTDFITLLKTNYGIQNFDLMACALYSDANWKYVIDTLAVQTGVTIRASADNTGSAGLGGNWFLESHTGVNMKGVYFTEAIEEYRGVLFNLSHNRQYSTKGFATGSLQAWGDSSYGGTAPNITSGVVAVYSTPGAFAALKTDGSIVAWGDSSYGGTAPNITSGVVAVCSNSFAFAALKSDGSIVAWGDSSWGGTTPGNVSSGVVAVYSSPLAFAALKSDGSIVAWGDSSWGGANPGITGGVVAVYSNNYAFAALKNDGSIQTWGSSANGGANPGITGGVVAVYSNPSAFAALKNDGSIVTWGNSGSGGANPGITGGVVAVYSNNYAFAALKNDGSIQTWGGNGAIVQYGFPSQSIDNPNISHGVVAVYSTSTAFAALKNDGSIVTWGNSSDGGANPGITGGVVAVYSTQAAFAALKSDGSIVAWGYSMLGGTTPGNVSSGVVAVYSSPLAFAALKSDGSIVVWGMLSGDGANPNITSGIMVYSSGHAFAALKSTATTFDLSMSYYTDMDRYNILRKKENRRRVNLTTLNNNVFTLSQTRDVKSFNPTIPSGRTLRIIVPDYVSSSYSITSTATIPSNPGSFIVASDEGEPVTISGVTYVNYGSYVYKRETNNTYTKLTTTTIDGIAYDVYGGDGINSSGIALVNPGPTVSAYGPFTPPAKTLGSAVFSMVPYAPTSDSSGAYTYTSSTPSVATINSTGTVVTIVGVGSTTITASQDACGNYLAGSKTGILTVTYKTVNYGTFTPPAKMIVDTPFSMVPHAPTSDSSGVYTYTSSMPSVATISSDGTVVTIVGQGSTTITVSQDICGNYGAGSKTGVLTISGLTTTYGTFTPPPKTFGDAPFSMVPHKPDSSNNGVFTYTSSTPSVATISSDGTVVTIVGQGSTTITASQDICGNYAAGSTTGTLTVARKAPTYGTFTPPAKTFGNAPYSIVSEAPTSESIGVYTYTSSTPSVATINSTGTIVTIIGHGSTTITASQDICGNYLAGSTTGTLTVARKAPVYGTFAPPAKTFGDASFSMVSAAPTSDSSGVYTYTSSMPSVATISSDGTVVTIVGRGSTTITASQDICGNYLAGSTTGTLTIAGKPVTYSNFAPPAKTFGDADFSMVSEAPITSDSSGVYTYTSSMPSVATISSDGTVVTIVGQGSTTITVSQDICGNYAAGSKTGTLTVARKPPVYSTFTPPAKTFGNAAFSMVSEAPITSDSSGVYTYTSSTPSVATINSAGTIVTIVGHGSTTITASQDICGNYAAGSTTGTLTVARKAPVYGTFAPLTRTFGNAPYSIVPEAPTSESIGVYTYTSSTPSVATINSTGTIVTIIGHGSTTITASQDICGNYLAGSTTGTLTVARKVPVYGTFTPPAKTFGDASFSMVSAAPTSESSGVYTYTSSMPSVATISSDGTVVTIVGQGSTTITVSQDICGNYAAGSKTGTLTVARKPPVYSTFTPPAKTFGDAAFSMVSEAPITSDSSGVYTYTSSTPSVATINSAGTIVTIVGQGSTTITASQDICGNYAAGSTTGTLTVARKAPTYATMSSIVKTYGDASFSLVPYMSGISNSTGSYTFTSSNPSVVSIGGDGVTATILAASSSSITITANQDLCGNYTAGTKTISLTVNRDTPSVTGLVNISRTLTQIPFTLSPTSNSRGSFSYVSDNSAVVFMTNNNTTFNVASLGTANITATLSDDPSGNYKPQIYSFRISIINATSSFAAATFTVPSSMTYGDTPVNITTVPTSDSSGAITYTSSNTNVATIHATTGVITAVGSGMVHFTATQAATSIYISSSVNSNNMNVSAKPVTLLRVAPYISSTITKYYGDEPFQLLMSSESNVSKTFSTDISGVVTVVTSSNIANVTITNVGTVTITGQQNTNSQYSIQNSLNWVLTVRKGTTTLTGLSSTLTKNVTDAPFTIAVSSDSAGTKSYALSNPADSSVLTVNSSSGLVTLKGPGSATIIASQASSSLYDAPSSVSCVVTVASAGSTLQNSTIPSGRVFDDVDMSGALLSGTVINGVSFAGATMTNVDLTGATLTNSTLTSANLAGVTLSNTDISGTTFASATMTNAVLTGATWTNSTLTSANLTGASMANTNISGTTFASATMTNAVLTGATLTNSTLTSANLAGVTLSNTDISGTTFASSILTNAVLTGATLTNSTLTNTDLSGASLVLANVTGSSFIGSTLTNADLSGATVTNADFTNANISGANITNVTFSDLQKIQLLKNINNRAISRIQAGDVSGSVILSMISVAAQARTIPNFANSLVKVIIPTTSTVASDVIPDIVLDVSSTNIFYFPINDGEYFKILGVKYYTTNYVVRNAATNEVVNVISYGSKYIWLSAGSVIIYVLQANTLSESTFTVPTNKNDNDSRFDITTVPTSNSNAPIVYSSNNTSVATIHPSTGLIRLIGPGYVNFTATQAQNSLYEAGSIISNTLTVSKVIIDFTLSGLDQLIIIDTAGILDASGMSLETTDATAVFYVKLSEMSDIFKYQSDAFDVNDISATDLKYYVFHRKWPAALKINPAHAMMNKTESRGVLGTTTMFAANKLFTKHDFIRYLALKLFRTIFGVALFKNTNELLENETYWGENVRSNIYNILTGISTTSSDVSMNYDASGNKYLTNNVSSNTNLCRELMRQVAASAPSRFGSIADTLLPQSVPFAENDSINFKVTFNSTQTQHDLTGVAFIPSRSYMIKLIMKENIDGLNTPVVDSEMYPNAYPYSSNVTTYSPDSAEAVAVYNTFSPPAPIPFDRFGFDGWYYTNSTAWVSVDSNVRNHVKWLLPASSGSATVGSLLYVRANLKIHNKTALPYIMVYTQSGSWRKYPVSNTGALANNTVYSFYVNFNSYTREPAMIGYTNAALANTVGGGVFDGSEAILNIALETDSGAAAGTVDFTLSSVIIGDSVAGEKEYGFEADVPAVYP